MGKRRSKRRSLFKDFTVDSTSNPMVDNFDSDTMAAEKVLFKRLKRQRKRFFKRCKKAQFAAMCDELTSSISALSPTPVPLPPSIPQVFPDDHVRHLLCSFVNAYLDAFDAGPPRKAVSEFYSSNAYLTFQIAPYLHEDAWQMSCDKKSSLTAPRGWFDYERFASNLIPGSIAVPAWAWISLSPVVSSLPKARRPVINLGKQQKQQLKVLRAFQFGHERRLESVKSFASSASDRGLHDIPPPPLARSEARGRILAAGLLSRLPDLIHIRIDDCSYLDVISFEPSGILFRYSCLAAEILPPTTRDELKHCISGTLQVGPLGSVLVRRTHRTLLITPHSPGSILQEDLCITPVAPSVIQTHSAAIIQHVLERMCRRARDRNDTVDPAASPFDDVLKFSSLTGMNALFSMQCLLECKFDWERALQAFQSASDAGLLPPEAFGQSSN